MRKILLKQMREDCMKGTRIGAEKPKKGVLGGGFTHLELQRHCKVNSADRSTSGLSQQL